jgi:hypothetical protein
MCACFILYKVYMGLSQLYPVGFERVENLSKSYSIERKREKKKYMRPVDFYSHVKIL